LAAENKGRTVLKLDRLKQYEGMVVTTLSGDIHWGAGGDCSTSSIGKAVGSVQKGHNCHLEQINFREMAISLQKLQFSLLAISTSKCGVPVSAHEGQIFAD
jgi:hypothetical protein